MSDSAGQRNSFVSPSRLSDAPAGMIEPAGAALRMSYPDGAVSPFINDLNSYIGVDVDSTRGSLVTSRRKTRTSVWVGDATGTNGAKWCRRLCSPGGSSGCRRQGRVCSTVIGL